jgi:hypothetical protein
MVAASLTRVKRGRNPGELRDCLRKQPRVAPIWPSLRQGGELRSITGQHELPYAPPYLGVGSHEGDRSVFSTEMPSEGAAVALTTSLMAAHRSLGSRGAALASRRSFPIATWSVPSPARSLFVLLRRTRIQYHCPIHGCDPVLYTCLSKTDSYRTSLSSTTLCQKWYCFRTRTPDVRPLFRVVERL